MMLANLGGLYSAGKSELQALISSLFGQGQQGVWYEPKPKYLYQDAAGTVTVTADGDPVGYMKDLSGNDNHATQSTSASRPIYRTDGTLHWLEFDGVDDGLSIPTISLGAASDSNTGILGSRNAGSGFYSVGGSSDEGVLMLHHDTGYRTFIKGASSILGATSGLFTSGETIVASVLFDRPAGSHDFRLNTGYSESETFAPSDKAIPLEYALGLRGTQTTSPFKGNIYGYALTSIALVESDRKEVEEYVADLAGVTL